VKLYHDKWIKENNEDICKHCNKNNTKFISNRYGYKTYCCKKCYYLNMFGVECYYQTPQFKEKRKETCQKKYGVNEPLQSAMFIKKRKETCQKKYGVDNVLQIKGFKENSMINKYGVENSMHNLDFFEKMQKTSKTKKQFKNSQLWYQGSYELDFLEKYYNKYVDIQRGPSIKYKVNDKNKIYYPDFYIPSLNLIVEIKSKYWYNMHKIDIIEKEKFTKLAGYNYLIILDKDYSPFIKNEF